MREQLSTYIDNAITVILLLIAGVTPLLFFNQTTEFYTTPKLIFLVVSTILLLGLWIFSWILKGKVIVRRTPLDLPLLGLLIVIVLSTFFSNIRYIAIYGNFPNVHGSAVSWVMYILLYFITVSHLKNISHLKTFLYVLYASAVLVSVITLLSFFKIYLPFDFAKSPAFTPTGSSFSTIAFLLLMLPLPILSILNTNQYISRSLGIILTILFSTLIILTGFVSSYVALFLLFAICLFVTKPNQLRKSISYLAIPVVVTLIVVALSFTNFSGNILFKYYKDFPREIQLPFSISWKISVSAFRDAPFIGTGPSSYLFNFTNYKPLEFNQLNLWNFSFDAAHNEFLQTLGTLGLLGLITLVLLSIVIFNISRQNLTLNENHEEAHLHMSVLQAALAISSLMSVFLFAIHVTTLVSVVITLFVFALFMVSQRSIREKVMEFSLGLKASTSDNKQFDLLPIIIFIIYLFGAVTVLFRTYTAVAADYYHRQALNQINTSANQTYRYLQQAERLNPYIDLYRVDMAQLNFALANAIAAQKGPSAASPSGSLTDQDRQTIQALLQNAINEGRASVVLSPRSSRNWAVLASIYRNISGVANNALAFSLDAYGRAIQLDPMNPVLRLNVGGIYYSIRNYDLAIRFFTDSANLKPDYANAYYNLAIALRDKGDLANAQAVAEQALRLVQNDPNRQNYKTASDLLADIKAKAPASQTNSALGNPNLQNINVSNLNNPPQEVSTPAAVTRNPRANLPQISPTRTPLQVSPTPVR